MEVVPGAVLILMLYWGSMVQVESLSSENEDLQSLGFGYRRGTSGESRIHYLTCMSQRGTNCYCTTTGNPIPVNPNCTLPSEVGPCRAAFRRWHYDSSKRSCQEFIYGGCRGNANNFESLSDCENGCGSEEVQESGETSPQVQNPAETFNVLVEQGIEPEAIKEFFSPLKRGQHILRSLLSHGGRQNAGTKRSQAEQRAETYKKLDRVDVHPGDLRRLFTDGSRLKREMNTQGDTVGEEELSNKKMDEEVSDILANPGSGGAATNGLVSSGKPSVSSKTKSTAAKVAETTTSAAAATTSSSKLTTTTASSSNLTTTLSPTTTASSSNLTTTLSPTTTASTTTSVLGETTTASTTTSVSGETTTASTTSSSESASKTTSKAVAKSNSTTTVAAADMTTTSTTAVEKTKSTTKVAAAAAEVTTTSTIPSTTSLAGSITEKTTTSTSSVTPTSTTQTTSFAETTTYASTTTAEVSSTSIAWEPAADNNNPENDYGNQPGSHGQNYGLQSRNDDYKLRDHTSSHFAAFFLSSIVLVFAIYIAYHNRQKIIAVIIEGRSDGRRRVGTNYRKLEANVEEAMPSMRSTSTDYVY